MRIVAASEEKSLMHKSQFTFRRLSTRRMKWSESVLLIFLSFISKARLLYKKIWNGETALCRLPIRQNCCLFWRLWFRHGPYGSSIFSVWELEKGSIKPCDISGTHDFLFRNLFIQINFQMGSLHVQCAFTFFRWETHHENEYFRSCNEWDAVWSRKRIHCCTSQ